MVKLITYITSTLFTYIFGIISKKKGWNEILPIPVQNIIIGIIVFMLSSIVLLILKENIDMENIVEQIIFALGGSGTATLAYDTQKTQE